MGGGGALGAVPASAEAVFFADPAEMIAVFARDACAGGLARWWWRALLRGLPDGPLAALTAVWSREARHVPAAVQWLAASGGLSPVAAALPAVQAARILAAVAHAHDLPSLLAAPAAAGRRDSPPVLSRAVGGARPAASPGRTEGRRADVA